MIYDEWTGESNDRRRTVLSPSQSTPSLVASRPRLDRQRVFRTQPDMFHRTVISTNCRPNAADLNWFKQQIMTTGFNEMEVVCFEIKFSRSDMLHTS